MKQLRVSSGQAILVMAVIILIFIAFAGLTIDVSHAYQEQRTLQSGSNAAAVAGMNSVVLNYNDGAVAAAVLQTLELNGLENLEFRRWSSGWPTDAGIDTIYYHAIYLNSEGEFLGDVGTNPSSIPLNGNGTASSAAEYVQVITSVDVGTTFANVVGVPKLPVGAEGIAGMGECLQGVYPVTFHQDLLDADPTRVPPSSPAAPIPMPNPYAEVSAVPASSRIYVSRDPSEVGISGSFLYVRWNGNENTSGANDLEEAFTGVGTLSLGFYEKTPPPTGYTNGPKPRVLEKGDWLALKTGAVASMSEQLDFHISNKTVMIIPIHDMVSGNGNNNQSGLRVSQLIKVRLLDYKVQGTKSFFVFGLVSHRAVCSQLTSPPDFPDTYNFSVNFNEQLLWYNPAGTGEPYDIAIVQDYSASMGFCMHADTYTGCGQGQQNRRIDTAIRVLTYFVDEMLVKRRQQTGANHRLAYVTFGGTATMQVPFMNDHNDALAAFKQKIGDVSNPKVIPGGANGINGNTNTAAGLSEAVALINSQKRPNVNLVVLLLTDGLSNVRFDGGQAGVPNNHNAWPPCGTSSLDMDNPFVQSTCPAPGPNNPNGITPPIQAAVQVADAGRGNGITFYAVVLGYQGENSPEDLRLDKIAPGHYAAATNEEAYMGLIKSIADDLGDACEEKSLTRIAAGATVRLYRQDTNTLVGTYPVGTSGLVQVNNLPTGNYRFEAEHLQVVAPGDTIARNYDLLTTQGNNEPVTALSFVMPETGNFEYDNGNMVQLNLNTTTSPAATCPE